MSADQVDRAGGAVDPVDMRASGNKPIRSTLPATVEEATRQLEVMKLVQEHPMPYAAPR